MSRSAMVTRKCGVVSDYRPTFSRLWEGKSVNQWIKTDFYRAMWCNVL